MQWTVIDARFIRSAVYMDRGRISGFTIRNGFADYDQDMGGGIYFWAAPGENGEISHNVIRDNLVLGIFASAGGGAVAIGDPGPIVIRENVFTANLGWQGGGLAAVDCIIEDNIFVENEACCGEPPAFGGGLVAVGGVVRNNLIKDNVSGGWAGGVWAESDQETPIVVENNLITDNDCWDGGGGVLAIDADVTVRNNTIIGNLSFWGGGGVYATSDAQILNNIIVGNSSFWDGGGIHAWSGRVLNNIVLDTKSGVGVFIGDYGGPSVADYNCLLGNVEGDWGGTGVPGPNNIYEDPVLDADMLHLLPGSPCIDAGDPEYLPEPGQTDPDGQPRIVYDRVDIGADEFLNPGDYDNDGDVDADDLAALLDCTTGPQSGPYGPGCEPFDADLDVDVDLLDFRTFQSVFTGSP